LPEQQKDEVEQMRLQLGLSKQDMMSKVFELGYPLLLRQMVGDS
jgi:hypothetical protein